MCRVFVSFLLRFRRHRLLLHARCKNGRGSRTRSGFFEQQIESLQRAAASELFAKEALERSVKEHIVQACSGTEGP